MNGDYTSFDGHTVRMMIRMFDVDKSGSINFEEFWCASPPSSLPSHPQIREVLTHPPHPAVFGPFSPPGAPSSTASTKTNPAPFPSTNTPTPW